MSGDGRPVFKAKPAWTERMIIVFFIIGFIGNLLNPNGF